MIRRVILTILTPLFIYTLSACAIIPEPDLVVTGQVIDGQSGTPISNALITRRASQNQAWSDSDGFFQLRVPDTESEIEITAWSAGYYIASLLTIPPAEDLILDLRPLYDQDNPDYAWIDPSPGSSEDACGNCHPMILPRWQSNAHGEAINNPRLFSFYNATDISGKAVNAPGYLADFPGTTGNCAACHAPGAAVDAPLTTNLNHVRAEVTAGIQCDFCHKVVGLYLDPATNEPYLNMPGVMSIKILRPPEGDQIFVGPYPDIHDPDTYQPDFSESRFCASCHQFSFWGTEIYNSYGEWLASDYAEQNITCQDCHMPPSGDAYFALSDQGGLEHPPESIPSHFQLGIMDEEFMQTTLSMDTMRVVKDGKLTLQITLANTGGGHHVPTDHPGRHMILVVTAEDQNGNVIPQMDGPVIPDWAGDLGGKPGKVFAKVLADARTGAYPVVDYWNPTVIESDTRIPANSSYVTVYKFPADIEGDISLHIQVLFRRLYQPIAEIYGWENPDLILIDESITVKPK